MTLQERQDALKHAQQVIAVSQNSVALRIALGYKALDVECREQTERIREYVTSIKSAAEKCGLQNSEQIGDNGTAIGAIRMLADEHVALRREQAERIKSLEQEVHEWEESDAATSVLGPIFTEENARLRAECREQAERIRGQEIEIERERTRHDITITEVTRLRAALEHIQGECIEIRGVRMAGKPCRELKGDKDMWCDACIARDALSAAPGEPHGDLNEPQGEPHQDTKRPVAKKACNNVVCQLIGKHARTCEAYVADPPVKETE